MSVESELDAIDNFPDTLKGIGDYVFTSKYARYRSDLNRRETWDEAVSRIEAMHLKKYDFLTDEQVERVNWAFDHVRKKNVLPSMRSMQFAGPAIEAQELRQFNCATRHVDSLRSFSEIFFLLLCGAGVGIGLSEKYIGRLPNLVTADDKTGAVVTYTVEDTIEGWSDSIEALLMCYFVNTIFSGRKMVFDYSKIRPAGTLLKTSGGQAPGYEGLKNAHAKIKALLDSIIENKGQRRLKTIDAYDILMHTSDAVLSGGVRRSACIAIFDKSDKDMMEAKTGNWFEENPQRARSNNSVRLIRGETSFDEFLEIIEMTKEWGEPGFIFANSEDEIMNPCLSKNAPILTKSGIKTVADILIGEEIWSESGWTKVVSKVSNGVKDVYEVKTPHGRTEATIEHKFVSDGKKVALGEATSLDWLSQDGSERGTDTIFEITKIGSGEVFDITVDNETHTHWSGGLNVSNCGEIGFIPVNDNGVCGVQVCNLTSINGGHVETADDFVEFAEAAAIIGTLQAGYTNFPYLSHVAKQLTEEEALLGVSITAMMDNPDVLFGEEYQRKASGRVMDVNREWAGILGINPAARTTCVKPEGTGTIVVGSMSSGVHPAHSRYMFRRVQANKLDNVYRFFQAHNYIHTEESVWSANKTDDVITFPIKLRDEVVVKDDLTAIEHLEMIRSTQNNWVRTGASDFNNKDTSHNVSCTVIVGDDEWEDVVRYVFDNRDEFAAVSFIPRTGDKDYAQAPMEAVVTEEDKDLFIKLMKGWNDVDYSGMFEASDETKLSAEAACAGPMGCDLK